MTLGSRRTGRAKSKRSKSGSSGTSHMGEVLDHYQVAWVPKHGPQKVLCPFHNESQASCVVNVEDGWANCHSCKATAGDPLQVVRLMENCDFPTAKRIFAEITGTEVESDPSVEAPARVAAGGYKPKFKKRGHGLLE